MTFKIDYLDDAVYEWTITPDGVAKTKNTSYTPTIYVSAATVDVLGEIQPHLDQHPRVATTAIETKRTGWRADESAVLRVDVESVHAVTSVSSTVRNWGDRPGTYKLYNVDFSREFRYCVENGIDPEPDHEPSLLEIRIPKPSLSDDDITPLTIGDTTIDGDAGTAIETLTDRLVADDPDILVLNSSDVVPTLFETAADIDTEFQLGRLPGYQELAGESSFESYGNVGHSPARYNVPGRAIIDLSNTFFWNQTTLEGVFDLVHRSQKPIQETAWASIGNVLTAIQIGEAMRQDVLVPWNSWRHEFFKSMTTLHEADRGGFIFAPKVGLHEDVHEVDFSSLYPNIIVTRNVSPDTIRCDCHSDREDVPGLGYSVCDERGYLADVLTPLIEDREAYKTAIRDTDEPEREDELRGRSEALKWILVSCFGYQGFSNAKFGRIECHEAINAYAREILLETKATLEDHGWDVIHGIVDSVWVTPDTDDPTPLQELCDELTEDIGIPLDYERQYDWIAFAPRRNSDTGALNRYFGRDGDTGEFKTRGIECRQRNTPEHVKHCQRELLETLAETRDPEAVCAQLQRQLNELYAGTVDPSELVICTTPSKSKEEYTQYTKTVAALERTAQHGIDQHPGESIEYVVTDDSKTSQDRVALEYENPDSYDSQYYADELISAAESILSPIGYRRDEIEQYIEDTQDIPLSAF